MSVSAAKCGVILGVVCKRCAICHSDSAHSTRKHRMGDPIVGLSLGRLEHSGFPLGANGQLPRTLVSAMWPLPSALGGLGWNVGPRGIEQSSRLRSPPSEALGV